MGSETDRQRELFRGFIGEFRLTPEEQVPGQSPATDPSDGDAGFRELIALMRGVPSDASPNWLTTESHTLDAISSMLAAVSADRNAGDRR